MGSVNAPGPGFLAFYVSLSIGFLTLIQFLREISKKPAKKPEPLFQRKKLQNVIYAVAFVLAYPFLFDRLGFFLCTLLFTGCCLKVIGSKKWVVVIEVSFLTAIIAYLVFDSWLDLQLPRGIWASKILSLKDYIWK